MRHVFAAIVMVLLFAPASAEAAAWDWVKELSGPGPSKGATFTVGTLCFFEALRNPNRDRDEELTVNTTRGWSPLPCVFVDRRSAENNDDDNFPNNVRIVSWDFGFSWKRNRGALELGAGAGFMRFHSVDRINNGGEMTRTKFTLTVARGVVSPIRLFAPDATDWRGAFSRAFKLYGRFNVITGTIDSTDFGVRAGTGAGESTWDGASYEIVPSIGILFDLGEFVFR